MPGGTARFTAVPDAGPSPHSVGNPVPGKSDNGLWCTDTVNTRGSS